MKNNLKEKLSILFIFILMILSTLLACNVLAQGLEDAATGTPDGKMIVQSEAKRRYGKINVKSEHTRTYADGTYIPYSDLDNYYDVFCCQKGTALPSEPQTHFTANGTDYSFPYLTMKDIGKTIGRTTTSGSDPYDSSYTHRTIGMYKIASTNRATPEEAYILSEMIKVDGHGEYNYCQIAWWNTEAGHTGNDVTPNGFSLEAKAFEQYIKEVSKITKSGQLVESDCKYKTAEFTDIDTDEEYSIENAFDFEYEPEWISEDEYAKPTVMYDQEAQVYTVGPFALHYVGTTEKFEDRPEVQFAGITDMELYTDASDEPLKLGTDWEIICEETVRCEDVDYEFPKSDEAFYIKLNYIDNATQITNIKTHFRYMNASGMYQKLQGKYFEATWTEYSEDNYDDDDEYESTTYWLKLTNLVEKDSQRLALGLNGCRWYEFTELDRSIGIKSKSIKIEKEVIDSDGEIVKTKDFFDFNVNVSGAINAGSDKVRVRANSSVETKTYYWLEGEATPTYDIKEMTPEGYELVSIENASGSLDSKDEIVVKAVNKTQEEHKGKLEIIKTIAKSTFDSSKYSIIGQKFKFIVTVSGTFKYDGKKYENETLTLYPEVTAVSEDEAGIPWTSNEFTWIDDEAPVYTVEETEIIEGAELVEVMPSAGVLKQDDTVRVEALNKQKLVGASIHLIKKLENSEYLSEEEIKELKFNFTLHVDGYDDVEITPTASRIEEDGKYIWVWEYTSSEYKWLYGNEPNYTITEHDNPTGTTFVSATADTEGASAGAQSISGKLVADKEKDFKVTNTIINKTEPNRANFSLTKTIDAADDESLKLLKNRDYQFIVTLKGNFKVEGEAEEVLKKERTVQFTNDSLVEIVDGEYAENTFVTMHVGEETTSAPWTSKQIEWYGNKSPKYKVEENLAGSLGENVKAHTITPSEGDLKNSDTIKVSAKNVATEVKSGRISIIKTLENAEKFDASYINSLEFSFRVEVAGYEGYDVSLKAKRVDDKFVWEYLSDEFFWKEGEEAPNYTIEEINLPAGTQFVSAAGPEGSSVAGTKITGKLIPSKNSDVAISTENSFINKLQERTGYLKLNKRVTHETLNGVDFSFTLKLKGTFNYSGEEVVNGEKTIENVAVTGGNTWNSENIKWYGNKAPTYSITEAKSDVAETVGVINGAGDVVEGENSAAATFTNAPIEYSGRIKIHKTIKDQPVNENDRFTFRITVDGHEPYEVAIKADETYVSPEFKWYAKESAPKYKVEEVNLPKGAKLVSISNAEGTISKDEDMVVEAVNQYEEHRGHFKLTKAIVEDKVVPDTMPTFEFDMTVTGQFTVAGQESTTMSIWTEHTSITGEGSYDSPEFIWYGDEPPVVHVSELDFGEDAKGWTFEGISNNDAAISENDTIEITVTNRYEPLIIIDLTMELGGTVWNDRPLTNDKNMAGSVANGILDQGEIGIDGVEVYVYIAGTDELATIYADKSKNTINQPIITSGGGNWNAPRVPVLKSGSYDVKFVYDGQTYEPTKPLTSGSASEYRGSSNGGRTKWLNDSMADDINREEVNARLTEIKGNTPVDGAGNTVGTAVGANGEEANILYEKSSGENENRLASKVITLTRDGSVIDLYKAEAQTSKVGLTYPFDQKIHLESFDITPTELGSAYQYVYSATYPYTLHINLGLVNREIADMDAVKDLVEAKVTVNERLLTYKFNKLADVGKDVLSRESYINGTDGNSNIQYQLGFYKTDYYYRAEMYKTSVVYDYMDTFYKSLGQTLDATNLEVYLKYKISVYNESPSYNVTVNEIADYFDSSFGTPIATEVKKYVQTIDGKETDSSDLETVARSSYVDSTGAQVNWNVTENGIKGSDGITYNKMTTDALKGMRLASGEKAEIYVYFKVEPTSVDGINKTIELANKSNVVEITNYSTYNTDGSIAGRIDVDSAAGNINIREYNEKPYYEDDTDSAPILKLTLDAENAIRSLKGYAWEDKAEDNTAIGNGLYDDGKEALIGGLTTELIEKIKVPSEGGYTEYDFLWPTNENLSCLGGRTVEELTGFDSTTETSRQVGEGEGTGVGSYEFTGVPVGNYIVRFLYGNDKSELADTFAVTGDPVALKSDASKFAEDENILVANYDKDAYGTVAAVYNGQDFKSTLYQINNNEDKTEWHNLKEYSDYNTDSDFVENEARRLETMANSRVITNVNGNILATANSYNSLNDNKPENYVATSNHAELYRNTYMISDSGKINFNVEKIDINSENSAVKNYEIETIEKSMGDSSVRVFTKERSEAYEVKDIAFGLIKRPETNVVLDKEIKTIKLITNDNRVIFDAEYDIDYKVVSSSERGLADYVVIAALDKGLLRDKYLVAEVKLSEINSISADVMQAINKNENKLTTEGSTGTGTQNFRFINVDETILQGTTIELGYKLTALNVGEKDTVSQRLADISSEEMRDENGKLLSTASKIKVLSEELENEAKTFSGNPQEVKTLDLGKYVGRAYYTGDDSGDAIVTTRVRQLVDYVDNDGTFTADYNNTENHSWRNTTVNELLGDGYESSRLLQRSLLAEHNATDKDKVNYITQNTNNIVLSIDNYEELDKLNNSGFEQTLYPYSVAKDNEGYNYKSDIELTVTKTVSATDDADNLAYDNIAEIVKYENIAGRRDEATIPGNANPGEEQFEESLKERDQSATELVTFTPPTGLEVQSGMTLQILFVSLIALVILAIGVVIIKKKVLN